MELCGEASTALEALELIQKTSPDLVISDLTLDGVGGMELIKNLQGIQPDLPILVVSMHDENLYAGRVLKAGARGYVMKRGKDFQIIDAIRRVLNGGFSLSESMTKKILLQYQGNHIQEQPSVLEQLTDRELEVYQNYGQGLSTREIGKVLHISPKTVTTHRNRIKAKLAIDTNAELLQRAVQWVQNQEG
jgi:DNA-binding NarL/FixJ family response regulator